MDSDDRKVKNSVPEVKQVPSSPSPLLLPPLHELDVESGVNATETTRLPPFLFRPVPSSHTTTTTTDALYGDRNVTGRSRSLFSPELNLQSQKIYEDIPETNTLALPPPLASIHEESTGNNNTGSGATLNPSILHPTSTSTTTTPVPPTGDYAAEEQTMWTMPAELKVIPASSYASRAGSFTLTPQPTSRGTSSSRLQGSFIPPPLRQSTVAIGITEDNTDSSDAASTTGDSGSVFDDDDYFSDSTTYTASLLSDVKDYTYENGRRYHSYREGHYVLPNDDLEQDRQDLLHHVRSLVLNGALFRAPVDKNLQRALDVGTGTGIWAIDFADNYPGTEVVGTDLSPIQPSWVPPNLRFLVDDAESPWLFKRDQPFDFIHMRDLGGSIADWTQLLQQANAHLKPGGWIELQEFEVTLKSDDDSMRLAPTLCQFIGHLHEASAKFHRPMNIAEGHRQRLVEAGFEDVRDEMYKVPCSTWPKDPTQKQIGKFNLASLLMAVESYSLALFTRVLGWTNLETQVFLTGVRKDLKNPKVHAYCNLHVVYGRKPEHNYRGLAKLGTESA
ncbi:hypothetical protein N7478_000319 [Penicillium angulare]|uniref:uncharacterized protein n=1 Tax=Penicillium angulare TaxID=116970 RepID=UPI002540B8D4|nr:uncharacterized protein N7478_000319 [Penicillium angulare]KAJ5291068.1 hypothetical protein N7478_000319 [Penicillium angulare]